MAKETLTLERKSSQNAGARPPTPRNRGRAAGSPQPVLGVRYGLLIVRLDEAEAWGISRAILRKNSGRKRLAIEQR